MPGGRMTTRTSSRRMLSLRGCVLLFDLSLMPFRVRALGLTAGDAGRSSPKQASGSSIASNWTTRPPACPWPRLPISSSRCGPTQRSWSTFVSAPHPPTRLTAGTRPHQRVHDRRPQDVQLLPPDPGQVFADALPQCESWPSLRCFLCCRTYGASAPKLTLSMS